MIILDKQNPISIESISNLRYSARVQSDKFSVLNPRQLLTGEMDNLNFFAQNLESTLEMDKQKSNEGFSNSDFEMEIIPSILEDCSGQNKYSLRSWERIIRKSSNPSSLMLCIFQLNVLLILLTVIPSL